MKKKLIPLLLAVPFLATSILISCNRDEDAPTQTNKEEAFKPTGQMLCGYVDNSWPLFATLKTGLKEQKDTDFITEQLKKNAELWGQETPTLGFVDLSSLGKILGGGTTYNAFSYGEGKIYYGYDLYYDAKTKGGDNNIANAMVVAHEYGHQLQFKNKLPSVVENTDRAQELEADGFAGFYLRKPKGFNKTDFTQIAKAYEFAESIGDNNVDASTHHGTPTQRRVAVRLGFLLGEFTLAVKDFDSQFFHYYSSVLDGTDPTIKTKDPGFELNAQIDRKIQAHMKELKDIFSGQISAEEFKNLN
ncbi:neutral zinc metallopeptidase [Elizabethkingia anophelis]|nr:neutral zinc metallopeptidase [Elizabethkingia anophelis]